jgi:hypothetical protein
MLRLFNNIMIRESLNIKDAHNQKEIRKRKQTLYRSNQKLTAEIVPPV